MLLPPGGAAIGAMLTIATSLATGGQVRAQSGTPYAVGQPLGVPNASGELDTLSPGVAVYGGIVAAESCVYDSARGLILLVNRGVRQPLRTNDAWVSMLRPDGSLHTARWIGVQSPDERVGLTPPLALNDPLGSEIADGVLYIADRDGGTGPDDPSVAVLRRFDLASGVPLRDARIEDSPWINDVAVAPDGTAYVTQTGDLGPDADPQSWRVLRVTPAGESSVVLQGPPLYQPNGIALDGAGNLAVVNYGDSAVLTITVDGDLLATEYAAQAGGDGIVILPDGTKYVSSVAQGGVSRLRRREPATLIARGIPGAASMCYDADRRRLVVPMTSESSVALVRLD